MVHINTIGFTRKPARKFFELLRESGANKLIDVRLNNQSQLAGFAKRDDLEFFTRELCGMDYLHRTDLAPDQALRTAYRKENCGWDEYQNRYLDLLHDRNIADTLSPELVDNAVLLCSEDQPHHCHRRLLAEYLADNWDDVTINHLS
ncbi:DUF488 domain-containing protein [Nocardia camponoti]|uniref:DUF488 family protein n=1 Tax=Nocardia camponoti TaxID=1616106 RepID=A0A917QD79_9NOCA|nr:DUF488 domain-containing protein [Nocardia camponoti]GGK44908.1 hypothetical protein GCM10011591_15630 [Nocardia camponoti]